MSRVNEDKSDQTRRVRRDDRGRGYGTKHMLDRFILSSIKRKNLSGDFPFVLLMALSSSRYGRLIQLNSL
jgi:hypothetical protein